VLLQRLRLGIGGDGVEIEVERPAPRQADPMHLVGPGVEQPQVGSAIDPRAVRGRVRPLGDDVEAGEQGDPPASGVLVDGEAGPPVGLAQNQRPADVRRSLMPATTSPCLAFRRQYRSANSGSGAKGRISIEWPARAGGGRRRHGPAPRWFAYHPVETHSDHAEVLGLTTTAAPAGSVHWTPRVGVEVEGDRLVDFTSNL
jgi:hypothetical protein